MDKRMLSACLMSCWLGLIACSSDSSHDRDTTGNTGGAGGTERRDAAAGATSGGASGAAGKVGTGGASGTDQCVAAAGAGNPTDAGKEIGDAGPAASRQTAMPLGSVAGAPNGFYEYLPPLYDSVVKTPLLVFWHGVGEAGNGASDLSKVLAWGPPKLISQNRWDNARPFIVLSPQWAAGSGSGPTDACPKSVDIDAFLTWAISHYAVDEKRVFLTGVSCGSVGGWDYIGDFQDKLIAAAVLLSGFPGDPTLPTSNWGRVGCDMGKVAIWALHGNIDVSAPYTYEQATMQNLIACPAPPRRDAIFTLVCGPHIIWDPIYDLSAGYGDIYKWMLTNAKP